MLVNFRFKNCRSFYQENQLSMQASQNDELSEINTFKVNEKLFNKTEKAELLKSALIFGGNASGKSNVLKAIAYMSDAVKLSASPQFKVVQANMYFEFYKQAINEESLYEVEIIVGDYLYIYGFTIISGVIKKEWLKKKKERETIVFERNANKVSIAGNERFQSLINVPDTTLFLSIGLNFNLSISNNIKDVLGWFNNLLIVFENQVNTLDIYSVQNEKYKKQAVDILKRADIGINDMSVVKDKIANLKNLNDVILFNAQMQSNPNNYGQIKQENENMFNIDLDTQFGVYDNQNNMVGTKNIMLFKDTGFHSEGTKRLLCYLGFILSALDNGRVLFMDEIDSRLHFLVTDYLIKMFNSIDKNPKNAQLICTAHNVMLMDEDLRRDQIYFTSKDEVGVSSLVSLVDYKGVRKNDLFSKKYLAGFYSKLPNFTK